VFQGFLNSFVWEGQYHFELDEKLMVIQWVITCAK
jgi:hypothetical protein